jgi:PAS domain S-box-containing protein
MERRDAALLRWFNDLAVQGIFTTDRDLKILSWNRWLELHTGRAAGVLVGRPLLQAWPELVERGFDQYYHEALNGQVRVVSQALHGYLLPMRGRRGNQSMPTMPQTARVAPLTEGREVIGTITIVEDVTERTVREAELRSRIDALDDARERAQAALRAKDEFLATLSHELRTPLNAVLGWARILRTQRLGEKEMARAIETIERNAGAQVRLIDDLLDMSRILSGKLRLDLRPIDLAGVVSTTVDVVVPSASLKGIALRLRLAEGLPPFVGDPERLQQVIWNLLSNAIKFTAAGGTVDVVLESTDHGVELRVHDSGQGIPPDFLPHVFERFRQGDASASRRHGGLGLGLALVRELVELHGGTVVAESAGVGQGATFSVRLPRHLLVPDPGSAPDDPLAQGAALPLKGQPVLVVDDEPDSREMLRTLLTLPGATVSVADSVQDALDTLVRCESHQRPGVIVTDLAMPAHDGYALLARLRATPSLAAIPVIALTAYASPEDRRRALDEGFAAYLTKPVDVEALITTITAVLARGAPNGGSPPPPR